jgi:hypothetical protein
MSAIVLLAHVRWNRRDHRIIPNSLCLQLYFSLMLDGILVLDWTSYRYIKNVFDDSETIQAIE